jgi:hypothetical protein
MPTLVIEEFGKLHKEDKSKDKNSSSQIMWAIALLLDPKSKFKGLAIKERKQIIATGYLKQPKFNWDTYKQLQDLYLVNNLSAAQRQLNKWNEFMDQKTEFLNTLTYTADSADMIEKLLLSNSKLYGELQRLEDMLVKDGEEGTVKGGTLESLSEKGEI